MKKRRAVLLAMKKTFRGRVVGGRGLGAAAMAEQRMAEAVRRTAGFDVVLGTLNVRLRRRFRGRLNRYVPWQGLGRPSPIPSFRDAAD